MVVCFRLRSSEGGWFACLSACKDPDDEACLPCFKPAYKDSMEQDEKSKVSFLTKLFASSADFCSRLSVVKKPVSYDEPPGNKCC